MVGWDKETDDDDTADVEEQDTDVDALDGLGQVATRVLRLTSCNLKSRVSVKCIMDSTATITYSNNLGTDERERRLRQDREPAKELALRAGDAVELDEGTGVLPVAETNAIVVGSAAQVEDDTEDDETGDSNDLDGAKLRCMVSSIRNVAIQRDLREDELRLAIYTSAEHVDRHDDDQTHRYPRGIVDGLVPKVDENGGCAQLSRQDDGPVVPYESRVL